MECKVINMTPELASHYLSNNPSNRPINQAHVNLLAAMMSNSQWALNGETIVVSSTGRLLDGQHRLAAVVKYGGSVPMLVASGALDAAFGTIDIGTKRTVGQICGMNGVPNAKMVAGAAAILFRMFHGSLSTMAVPAPCILEVVARYPELPAWSNKARRAVISSASLLAACVYLDAIAHRADLAERLIDGLKTGADLARGNPVLALRNRTLNARGGSGENHTRAAWAALVRTIDALEADESLVVIKLGVSAHGLQLRPARFLLHTRHFTPRRRLLDLAPVATPQAA